MRSEGTVVGSVCLSVSEHLTNDTTYLTGNEGQKVLGFSLKMLRCRASALPALHIRYGVVGHFTLRKTRMLKTRMRKKSRLPHAIYYCS